MSAHRAIVLAAGKSVQLDGQTKVLLEHPTNGKTVLEHAVEAFGEANVCVVVGYRAIEIMQRYPRLQYVYNANWALTNNAASLALALNEEPSYVVAGDIFFERELIARLDEEAPDLVLSSSREKRGLTAIHCVLDAERTLVETYQGPLRSIDHPEAVGLVKLTSQELLRDWKRRCLNHSNLFAGQLLPCESGKIKAVELGRDELFFEINTPADYIDLIDKSKS